MPNLYLTDRGEDTYQRLRTATGPDYPKLNGWAVYVLHYLASKGPESEERILGGLVTHTARESVRKELRYLFEAGYIDRGDR